MRKNASLQFLATEAIERATQRRALYVAASLEAGEWRKKATEDYSLTERWHEARDWARKLGREYRRDLDIFRHLVRHANINLTLEARAALELD